MLRLSSALSEFIFFSTQRFIPAQPAKLKHLLLPLEMQAGGKYGVAVIEPSSGIYNVIDLDFLPHGMSFRPSHSEEALIVGQRMRYSNLGIEGAAGGSC